MKIGAFTYVRNGIQFLYPFIESIQSVLPIVDDFVVVVGDSTDGTREAILALQSQKIRIVDTVWDMSLRTGGQLFANQANAGLDAVKGDWLIHIQADEVIHEKDVLKLKEHIVRYDRHPRVEGLLFPFLNFRGDYDHIHTGRCVHRHEIRAVRRNPLVRSYRDSQGFRKYSSLENFASGEKGEKLSVVKIDIPVFHYSYVRPPKKMKLKSEFFSRFYNSDEAVQQVYSEMEEFEYNDVDHLERFRGTHPASMQPWIKRKDWNFKYDPSKARVKWRHRLLNAIERLTGWRIGEYRNYRLLKPFHI